MVNTYADIIKNSPLYPVAVQDSDTPAGHFLVMTKILGVATLYMLKDTEPKTDAPIVGRIEYFSGDAPSAVAYKGSGLKGGLYSGRVQNTKASLELFV